MTEMFPLSSAQLHVTSSSRNFVHATSRRIKQIKAGLLLVNSSSPSPKTKWPPSTDRLDNVRHFDEFVAAEFRQEGHRSQEAEVVLESSDGSPHHDGLEHASLQLPDVHVRHGCGHGA